MSCDLSGFSVVCVEASKTEEVEDFIVESAVTLDFNHPNILRLVGVCFDTQDKLPAIVLPYMANRDLRSFLKSRRSKREMSKTIPEVHISGIFSFMSC